MLFKPNSTEREPKNKLYYSIPYITWLTEGVNTPCGVCGVVGEEGLDSRY